MLAPRINQVAFPLPAALLSLTFGTVGCGQALGPPEQFPTATVTGRILEGGRPVGGGWIEFTPIEGTVGNIRSVRLQADGSFHVDRVAIGENSLKLVNLPLQILRGLQRFGQLSIPVRRVITAKPAEPLQLDLVDEATRFQAGRPRRPRYEIEFDPGAGNAGKE